jgi:protein SCO1/2
MDDQVRARSSRRTFLAGLTGLAAAPLLAACDRADNAWYQPKRTFHATDIGAVDWGRGFELTDHTGRRRTLVDFRGKVVLLFFGFTNCPDVCPTAMAEMAQVVGRLGPDGARVQGLFVTVDPERDMTDVLAKYVTAFYPTFIGLRGSVEETTRTGQEFKIHHARNKSDAGAPEGGGAKEYAVDHSAGIFVFDVRGKLRLYVGPNARSVDHMVSDVKRLLRS